MDTTTAPGDFAPGVPTGLEVGLPGYWYPVLESAELADRPVPFQVLDRQLVAWRDGDGAARILRDRCPHRAAKLSIGLVLDGQMQCAFHGLRFDGGGRCVLIPWSDETPPSNGPSVDAYVTEELGGYVWAYLDPAVAAPPPLRDEVPEELVRPDDFAVYRLPNEVWDLNWLIAVDGSDAFHAVVLHAQSQAVADRSWTGGAAEGVGVALADRRVRIVDTPYGIRGVATDREGNTLHHGHLLDEVVGDRFNLPCLTTNPITAVPGTPPYVARLWQLPVDYGRTLIVRYVVWRRSAVPADLDLDTLFADVVGPRLRKVSAEDKVMGESQGDLLSARQEENLLAPDGDMYEVRDRIAEAYEGWQTGERHAPQSAGLVFPVG